MVPRPKTGDCFRTAISRRMVLSSDPGALYLPVVTDPAYHYQAVNVAAQEKDPASPLNTMRRLIAVRKQSAVFGRGTIEFLRPRNQAVLAYLRAWRDGTLLVVGNLSARTQPVELDLAAHEGAQPGEMLSRNRLPAVARAPYFLSLGPHGYYWFRLERRDPRPLRYGIEDTAI